MIATKEIVLNKLQTWAIAVDMYVYTQ